MPLFTNFQLLEFSPSLLDYPLVYEERLPSFPPFYRRPNLSDGIPSSFELFDDVLDLALFERRTPFSSCYRRIRSTSGLTSLYDRVTALDLVAFDPVFQGVSDRKYTWTDEIKCPEKWLDQKYKMTAEIKGSGADRKYKWTAEIESPEKKGFDRKYMWSAEIKGDQHDHGQKHKEVSIKIKEPESGAVVCRKDHKKKATRLVEIEEPLDQGAIYLRQAFAKRAGAVARARGKAKALNPEAAALLIQVGFRTYLIRRSQALRSLRELAITKAKLKEIRVLFNNFTYRRCIARDVEERKRFAERIIALLLSVDAIQGADLMVRAARRSMLDELEAMLDLVDPQPPGKLGFLKRRRFESVDNSIQREMAAGVADVVQMLDQAEKSDNATFQVCL